MRIAFVIGHHARNKGAYSKYFQSKEYDFFKHFECELSEIGTVFYHDPLIFSYSRRQKSIAIKTEGFDLVFELHFNASNGQAKGCEALYYEGNTVSKNISNKFCRYYTNLTKTKNRGARVLYNKNQRGYQFVYRQKPNAVLLEPFFGDNENDCKKFNINNFINSIKYAIK